jgi:hypothetical protein
LRLAFPHAHGDSYCNSDIYAYARTNGFGYGYCNSYRYVYA